MRLLILILACKYVLSSDEGGYGECKHTDKNKNCPSWRDTYCTDSKWGSWMAENCAKSCKCEVCKTENGKECRFAFGYSNGAGQNTRYEHCAKVTFVDGEMKKKKPWCSQKGGGSGYCQDSDACKDRATNYAEYECLDCKDTYHSNPIDASMGFGSGREFDQSTVYHIGAAAEVQDASQCCSECIGCCGRKLYTYDVEKKTCLCMAPLSATTNAALVISNKNKISNVCGGSTPAPTPDPIDGGWSKWSKCSEGKKVRTCSNPKPEHGGKQCQGLAESKEGCEEEGEVKCDQMGSKDSNDKSVTVTAKFWYVSDYGVNPQADATADADKYVAYINKALTNSKIPVKYKRWGSVQRLPKTNEEIARQDKDYNTRFVHGLGDNLEAHKKLKHSADHIILLMNSTHDHSAKCKFFKGAGFGKERYATAVVPKYVWGDAYPAEETFAHEAGHCMLAHHNRETLTNGASRSGIAYGYCLPNADYATIMAYERTCKRDKSKTIPYYSNPDVEYEGHATGTRRDNNAKVMTDRREYISNLGDNCLDGGLDVDSEDAQDMCKTSKCWKNWTPCCCKKVKKYDSNEDYDCWYGQYTRFKTERKASVNALGEVLVGSRIGSPKVGDCAKECGCNFTNKNDWWCTNRFDKKDCDTNGDYCARTCNC